ncbi:hypothetical protein [Vibrio sp. WXL210]|uniref:hypothetical protein n=1 Tax=Vibrio sp. WXL210 TaxID=3450709 RepID=UPI003EC514BF
MSNVNINDSTEISKQAMIAYFEQPSRGIDLNAMRAEYAMYNEDVTGKKWFETHYGGFYGSEPSTLESTLSFFIGSPILTLSILFLCYYTRHWLLRFCLSVITNLPKVIYIIFDVCTSPQKGNRLYEIGKRVSYHLIEKSVDWHESRQRLVIRNMMDIRTEK